MANIWCLKFIFAFLVCLPSTGFSLIRANQPDDKCTTVFGRSRYCTEGRGETFLAFKLNSYIGERHQSQTGSYSYNLSMTTVTSKNWFSFLFGGQVGYGIVNFYLNNSRESQGKFLSVDIPMGISMKLFRTNKIRPVIDLYGLVGFKNLDLTSPPSGVDYKTIALSYGYAGSFGLEFSLSKFTRFRATIDYETNQAPNLANQDKYNLNALAYKLGIVFEEF